MKQDATTAAPIVEKDKSSDAKKWMIIAAVACFMAICGIGFGIYGMAQSSQKDAQIADLKNKNNKSNRNTTPLDSREEEERDDDEDRSNKPASSQESKDKADNSSTDAPLVSSQYLEIPELGIKVKLPNIPNDITYKKYVSELGDVFYDLYSDGKPTGLSVFYVPKTAGAVPDTTIHFSTVGDNTYAIALKNRETELQPPASTLADFFRNADEVFVKL